MGQPREESDREHRIADEVIVDAYDSVERAMSWYYYLEAKLRFPFAASCIVRRQSSPLKVGERIEVVGLASEDECMLEVLVVVTRSETNLAVPLGQLKCESGDEQTMPSRRGLALLACARLCLLKRPCRRDNSDEDAAA